MLWSVTILQFQWMWDFNWSLGAELSSKKSFLGLLLLLLLNEFPLYYYYYYYYRFEQRWTQNTLETVKLKPAVVEMTLIGNLIPDSHLKKKNHPGVKLMSMARTFNVDLQQKKNENDIKSDIDSCKWSIQCECGAIREKKNRKKVWQHLKVDHEICWGQHLKKIIIKYEKKLKIYFNLNNINLKDYTKMKNNNINSFNINIIKLIHLIHLFILTKKSKK